MTDLIPSISIDSLLAARDAAQAVLTDVADAVDAANERLRPFGVELPRFEFVFGGGLYRQVTDRDSHPAMKHEIDRLIWLRLFQLTNVDSVMDSTTRKDLWEKLYRTDPYLRHEGETMPTLTKENVEATFGGLADRVGEFFDNAVESVFKSISWCHKTNGPNGLKRKLIVDYAFSVYHRALRGTGTRLDYNGPLADLERVLMTLAGRTLPTNATGISEMGEVPWGEWYYVPAPDRGASVLRIKVHMKGTTHVEILDDALIDQMNRIMARKYPGRIPESELSKASRPDPTDVRRKSRRGEAPLAHRDKQEAQAFHTPPGLARRLVRASGLSAGDSVIDPSGGHGALLEAARMDEGGHGRLVAIENESSALEVLGDLGLDRVWAGDCLTMTGDDVGRFDVVLMNPPFTGGQDAGHVRHAFEEFLAPGGTLVAIVSRSCAEGIGRVARAGFVSWVEDLGGTIEDLPDGSFVESGTNVATSLVVLTKGRG